MGVRVNWLLERVPEGVLEGIPVLKGSLEGGSSKGFERRKGFQ